MMGAAIPSGAEVVHFDRFLRPDPVPTPPDFVAGNLRGRRDEPPRRISLPRVGDRTTGFESITGLADCPAQLAETTRASGKRN